MNNINLSGDNLGSDFEVGRLSPLWRFRFWLARHLIGKRALYMQNAEIAGDRVLAREVPIILVNCEGVRLLVSQQHFECIREQC